MPGYRLYRSVVIGATGRAGEALTRQLLLSPLCSEVHALGRRETRAFDGLAAAEAKLRQHTIDIERPLCGLDASVLDGVDAAFCLLGARGGWAGNGKEVEAVERDGVIQFAELCSAAKVPHISLLTSAWADRTSRVLQNVTFARAQSEAVETCTSIGSFERVSVFRPSALVDSDGEVMRSAANAPLLADAVWRSLPYWSQLLWRRYRQLQLADLILAMRLNAELCDPLERVELLDYEEMMQIIGRDVAL
jgi:hypothetical protein